MRGASTLRPGTGKNGGVTSNEGASPHGIGRLLSLRRRRSLAQPALPSPGGVSPAAAAEIEAVLASVEADAHDFAVRLSSRLYPLVRRGVPPRVIERAPVPKVARLRFADGTTVLVKLALPGDLGAIVEIMRRSVTPSACRTDPDGSTHLVFRLSGGHRLVSLRVVGLDQPD